MKELFQLLQGSRRLCVLTGAGVSTLSGIPDFRSAGGLYSQKYHGMAIEDILSIDVFRENPGYFYGLKIFVQPEGTYAPNIVHTTLVEMEHAGMLKTVFTQNIDRLHTIAGSKDVVELHGSPSSNHCIRCGEYHSFSEIIATAMKGEVPHCRKCGGAVKPDIIFYGENLDEVAIQRAIHDFSQADVTLVLGTSLVVHPAAALPEYTLRHGGKVVIVNRQETPLDQYASLRYDDLKKVFSAIHEWLHGRNA